MAQISKQIFPGLMMPPFHYACFTDFAGYSQEHYYTTHNSFQVILGLSGTLEFELERDRGIIKSTPNQIFVLGPGIRHRWQTHGVCRNFMFFCDGFSDDSSELCRILNIKRPDVIWDFPLEAELSDFYVEKFHRLIISHSVLNADIMHGLLYAFCGEICREAGQHHPVGSRARLHPSVARAIEMIQRDYRERITLAQLSKHSGMSPGRLSELFHESYGVPPMQYVCERRIKKASQLLACSDMNVGQIAEYLGFHSIHYFSRLYKKQTGETPSAVAKRAFRNTKIVR